MKIESPAFVNNETIPDQYTARGRNISPPFVFSGIPAQAQSLVLIVEDLDATPERWTHWLVFNISAATSETSEGAVPSGGTEGYANGGTSGYEGPNQVYFRGIHRYRFRLLAIDRMLDIPPTADKAQVLSAVEGRLLASAELIGLQRGDGSALS